MDHLHASSPSSQTTQLKTSKRRKWVEYKTAGNEHRSLHLIVGCWCVNTGNVGANQGTEMRSYAISPQMVIVDR